MGGACEAAARGGARAEEAHLISSEARKAGSKPPKAGKNRTAPRVDELPQEARFVSAVTRAYVALQRQGAKATVAAWAEAQ